MSLILLANEDGVRPPGLQTLKQALEGVRRLAVFASDYRESAAGCGSDSAEIRVQPSGLECAAHSSAFAADRVLARVRGEILPTALWPAVLREETRGMEAAWLA